ncbi:response regulator [Sulfitobacter sp. D35]|uniref:response regulator n=1 Tax=Sulfitobacter sp. D35 TaxID=3083252 RepID=UPI00296EA893|nr:response regulator [Sulfitobacter sp. D35]MDW4497105.1 response regulator [Sulfitobacter sp. D35]
MNMQISRPTREASFLLIDDDTINIRAMQRAFRKLRILNRTLTASDGIEGLEILREAAVENGGELPPFIVILDLNMPRMGGIEFLEVVRSEPALQRAVIFVFSSSETRADIQDAYRQNVAGYIVKENPYQSVTRALEMLGSYSRIVELPG